MIDFPANPGNGQQYTQDGRTWAYVSAKTAWQLVPVSTADADKAAAGAIAAAASAASSASLLASVQATTNNRLLPTGGVVGQVPMKTSGGYAWTTVSGGGGGGSAVVDLRKLAPLYAGGLDGKVCDHLGDSTVWQLDPTEIVKINGTQGLLQQWFPELRGMVHRNYGENGQTMQAFITGSLPTAAARKSDAYVVCYGLNDERIQVGLGAYNSAANIAEALRLQGFMRTIVTTIKGQRADACILFRMPNPATVDSFYLGNGQTAQKMNDVLRLAYRGDPALGVPSPETFGDNVLVFDTMAVAMPPNALVSVNQFLQSPNDGLHPGNDGYYQIMWPIGYLMSGPAASSITSEAHARQLAAREKAIAAGWAAEKLSLETVLYSDEWYPAYNLELGLNAFGVIDLFIGPGNATDSATGSNGLGNVQQNNPAGLSFDDVVVWGTGVGATLMSVRDIGDFNMGDGSLRFTGTFLDGVAVPTTVSGRGIVYRHRYAHSTAARRNALALASKTPVERAGAFPNAIRFCVMGATVGTLTVRAIGGEVGAQSGLDASEHAWSVSDRLALAGVEYSQNGMPLTGATFVKSGHEVVITLAGYDFTNRCGDQGFVLAGALGASGGGLVDIFNESLL